MFCLPTTNGTRISGAVVIALLSFAIGCAAIGGLFKYGTNQENMLRHLASNSHQYDHVFIGSSLVRNQVIAAEFDQLLVNAGMPSHTFVLADWGARPIETIQWLRQLVKMRGFRPRTLFFDLSVYPFENVNASNYLKSRVIYWHDWHALYDAAGIHRRGEWTFKDVSIVSDHVVHTMAKASNLGVLASKLVDVAKKVRSPSVERSEWRPYYPRLEEPSPKFIRSDYSRSISQLTQLIEAEAGSRFDPQANETMRKIMQIMEGLPDTKVAFLLAPIPNLAFGKSTPPQNAWLFDFNDPTQFPELYDVNDRYDSSHLLYRGSIKYTHAIAQAYLDRLESAL